MRVPQTIEELRTWIEGRARTTGAPEEQSTPYVIVRRSPKSGAADWSAVSSVPERGARRRWSFALRRAIGRAQLLFGVR